MSYQHDAMKWLKYRHKFSSGRSAWTWKPIWTDDGEKIDEAFVRSEILPDLADAYNYSDKYSGIDFELLDKAPSWIIEREITRAQERADEAVRMHRKWQAYLQHVAINSGYEDCRQCSTATVPSKEHYREHGQRGVEECPLCGRSVLEGTLKFRLMPDDKDAVKLLGSLVEQGPRSVKSKKSRWPVEDKDEEAAFNRLVTLGLAGGSSYQNVHEIHASKAGELEWQKHKSST